MARREVVAALFIASGLFGCGDSEAPDRGRLMEGDRKTGCAADPLGGCAKPSEPFSEKASSLYFGNDGVWRADANGVVTVKVCWETPGFPDHKARVRSVVAATWSTILPVDFVGWTDCDDAFWGLWPDAAPIRIQIADDRQHAYYPDTAQSWWRRGHDMRLNFTFSSWGTPCAASDRYLACVDGATMHEFGHALGFAHEQDQPDSTCATEEPDQRGTGVSLTSYDPNSIMNYCDPTYETSPQLSPSDIAGAQSLYGIRAPLPTYTPL